MRIFRSAKKFDWNKFFTTMAMADPYGYVYMPDAALDTADAPATGAVLQLAPSQPEHEMVTARTSGHPVAVAA